MALPSGSAQGLPMRQVYRKRAHCAMSIDGLSRIWRDKSGPRSRQKWENLLMNGGRFFLRGLRLAEPLGELPDLGKQ
jgi:hypothetical protein